MPLGEAREINHVRESALASINKLQTMLAGPTDFLQQLVSQTQLLACLQWLGEFQVPAYIPLEGGASVKDVADLIGVPETQLCRVIRMVTTAGFLQLSQQGYITHTPLSISFVAKPSYLDAAMFLAGTAAPAALEMTAAIKQPSGSSEKSSNTMHNTSFNNTIFSSAGETQSPRLQRQWHSYLRYGTGYICDTATDILTCLEPLRNGNASVVEVGARSTERASALANQYPRLRFTVQLSPMAIVSSSRHGHTASKFDNTRYPYPDPRITVQHRVPGTPQHIQDAAVYILNFPLPMLGVSSTSLATQIKAELNAHLNAIRVNHSAIMVLTAPVSLEPGLGSTEAATLARVRDLSLSQLGNERELEMSEVLNLLNGVSDSEGRIVLVNIVRPVSNSGAIALEVKYQVYADR
ncbi:hypothetical protein BGW36DRAFT_293914 [Talaromyces proteolyticus]|uniref:Uncharacterized protein n=1 Tax=Talaromyces proteolyticus TaxID=1131652 RepID=A0AAD4Q1Q6_9EURO|nr:uncharacterized protein BGW36DRAFT_293914 [Talaromyces proteolyticus]KAH8698803.1 hypothetical protein BGW36DRAFT_293914 [Talaromyces proteolyticus]